MRILILATDIYTRGGVARYTATLAEALSELPASVDVLPLLGGAIPRDPTAYRILTPTTARLTPAAKIRHALRAFQQARRTYDLVVCSHLSQATVAGSIWLGYGTPYLVVAHGSEAWGRLPLLKRIALRRARAVLAVSAYTARMIALSNRLPAGRVTVVYNAISTEFARRLGEPVRSVAGAGRTLLSVGSLNAEHAYKGIDTVIRALPRILAAMPEARYVVAGGGDERPRLERLAASVGVRDRVTFAGEVSDEELVNLYRACDVFVLPSRASTSGRCEGEGFGRVYMEAALACKPVVGSSDAGAAEAMIDGRTGLMVDPRSVPQVADAVIRLLQSPAWASELGVQGHAWAQERFTITAMRRVLKEILDGLSASSCRLPIARDPGSVDGRPLPVGSSHCAAGLAERSAVGDELQSSPRALTDNRLLTTADY